MGSHAEGISLNKPIEPKRERVLLTGDVQQKLNGRNCGTLHQREKKGEGVYRH